MPKIPFIFVCLSFLVSPAIGQQLTPEYFGRFISDKDADTFLKACLDRIHLRRCGSRRCDVATSEELKNPPISISDARAAMAFATMGAWSEFCNLDQKRAFFPLMTFAIEVKKFNERQLALLSLIYVDFQARQLDAYKKQGNCPAEVKDRFDKALLQFKR